MKILFMILALAGFNVFADTRPLTYNRIHLSAVAVSEVENDLKVAELYSKHQGKNSVKVSNQINRDITWAVKAAKASGVEVKTLGYNTTPLYEYNKNRYNRNKIVGWSAEQAIQIKSRDSELLGEVIGKLQKKLKMRSLNYQVSKDKQAKVKAKLIDEAIAKFVKRARKIAKGFAMNSYKLVNVNINTGAHFPRPAYRGKSVMMAADAVMESATVESGTSEINVSITGEIELN